MTRSILAILICLLLPAIVGAQAEDRRKIFDQKNELERIKTEVQTGQQRLDSLKSRESQVQDAIKTHDKKISSGTRELSALNRELSQLQNSIQSTEDALRDDQLHLERTRRRYLGDIRQFYLSTRKQSLDPIPRPNRALHSNRQVMYLTALAVFEAEHVASASGEVSQTLASLQELSGEEAAVSSRKKKSESHLASERTRKKNQQQELERVRQKTSEEADRILMLQQAARDMEAILARLEADADAAERGSKPDGPSVFASLQGQLPAPCDGRIAVRFGPSVDRVTRLRSFSPGVSISGRAGRPVAAIAAGSIAYVGSLRGYGKFVIINHDDHYYSTYAGLDDLAVTKGQYVFTGTALARAGTDGIVKFELRNGREPLDPLEWVRRDAF